MVLVEDNEVVENRFSQASLCAAVWMILLSVKQMIDEKESALSEVLMPCVNEPPAIPTYVQGRYHRYSQK